MKSKQVHIFSLAFLILFLELSLIRFLPAQIACLGYYSNFILLASFIGISAGILLAKNNKELIWYFPWALLLLIYLTTRLTFSIIPDQKGEIHFFSIGNGKQYSDVILVPIIFCFTSIIFALISQALGRLLNELSPLEAYLFDILGSILGIVVFTLLSYYQLSPVIWFSLFSIVFLLVNWKKERACYLSAIAFLILIFILNSATKDTFWSPYQKVTVTPEYSAVGEVVGHNIFVNNIYHQTVVNDISRREFFYKTPYYVFNNPTYKNVLIIGSGTGNDLALALANNAESIDAVEIDPVIKDLGCKLNPYNPYASPKVMSYVTDGRSYLQSTKKKYDLIIYALTDSLTLAASHSAIRLESFLFTKNSFESAKEHLNENGLLVLYNNYRQPWLICKLSKMLISVFGRETFINNYGLSAILMNGNKLNDLKDSIKGVNFPLLNIEEATDDWPFPYLYERSIPETYLVIFVILGLVVYFSFSKILLEPLYKKIDPVYFFLGVAFLLLETRSIILFSLFFGTTWLVNALVFLAILVLVFFAITLVKYLSQVNLKFWYTLLIASLVIQYLFPMQLLLSFPILFKYLFVSVLTLSPVFFANVVFSGVFKDSTSNSLNFASNILGAAVGGVIEYSSLLMGYKNLIFIIILCYLYSFSKIKKVT